MIIVARIGIHIPVPGINMDLFKDFQNNAIAGFFEPLFRRGSGKGIYIFLRNNTLH